MEAAIFESIVRIAFGLVILFVGRNLFWLFIGLIGFVFGFELAGIWLADQPAWLMFALALLCGGLGAVLTILFERVAFAVAGFYGAAYLAVALPLSLGLASVQPALIILGGCIGAVLAALLMDWAIIIVSALAGATIIVSALNTDPATGTIGILVLAVLGALVQRALLARRRTE